MHALALLFAAALLAPAGAARPLDGELDPQERDEPATPVSDAPRTPSAQPGATGLAVGAHFGIATPYGGAGAALDARLIDRFAIEAGLGLSIGGPQFAGMLRLRFPSGSGVFTIGTGVSAGAFHSDGGPEGLFAPFGAMSHANPGRTEWDLAWWSNTELGIESSGPTLFRVYLGYGAVLDDYDRCDQHGDPEAACEADTGLIYIGASVGLFVL